MIAFSCLIFLLLLPTDSFAHGINISAWIEGDRVVSESKFSSGTALSHGKITVIDESGKPLLQGTTDHDGKFSFPIPEQKPFTIIVNSTDGHRAEWTWNAENSQRSSSQPGMKDLFAGVGYIVGLIGLGTYLHYRKKLKDLSQS